MAILEEQKSYFLEKIFKEKLKIYFVELLLNPRQREGIRGIIAYRPDEALDIAKKRFSDNKKTISLNQNDFMYVEEVLEVVGDRKEKEQPQKPQKSNKEQFKWSLQLAKDEYVKSKEDKKVLEKIIEKI